MRINVLSVQGTPREFAQMPGLVRFLARRAVGLPVRARGRGRVQRPALRPGLAQRRRLGTGAAHLRRRDV
jgi:hypothetical protein